MRIPTSSRFLLGLAALTLGVFVGCSDPNPEPEILECSGACECDAETNTCSCLGGTDCVIEGDVPGMTLLCEGNARCDLECGDECHVECPGTGGCDALMGANSTGVCNGTGSCTFLCVGDCSVDCPGSSSCVVSCTPGSS
jgi:hypothetical protein